MPCIKIDKPLVVCYFAMLCNYAITRSQIYDKISAFHAEKRNFKIVLKSYDKKNLTFILLFY